MCFLYPIEEYLGTVLLDGHNPSCSNKNQISDWSSMLFLCDILFNGPKAHVGPSGVFLYWQFTSILIANKRE